MLKNNYQIQGLYTDRYELEMALAYWQEGRENETASFDYSFRTNPFKGGFTVFAGLETLIHAIQAFQFPRHTLVYLKQAGFPESFLKYLKTFRFQGRVYAVREGEIVFPLEPIVRVEGTLIESQLIETLILNILNFQSLVATKAVRCARLAGDRSVSEFGLRRAQGLGGIWASRAAVIGGCANTSNMEAGRLYDIPVVGTMAHSFVQSYDDELDAFRAFSRVHGSNSVFLVDTYDTLNSGVPNAIKAADEMAERGESLRGIRLDSGDLAYLSRETRGLLDEAGLKDVLIVASNQLDEWIIRSLNEQNAPIDVFGIGTNLVVGKPDAALDGVYKLNSLNNNPRMKLSETRSKETLPGIKEITRFFDSNGRFAADAIHSNGEKPPDQMVHPIEPEKQMELNEFEPENLLKPVMAATEVLTDRKSVCQLAEFVKERLKCVPHDHLRLENPHIYRVGISATLSVLRDQLKDESKKKILK